MRWAIAGGALLLVGVACVLWLRRHKIDRLDEHGGRWVVVRAVSWLTILGGLAVTVGGALLVQSPFGVPARGHSKLVHGVTRAGTGRLCVSKYSWTDALCAPVEYPPGQPPGCTFVFRTTGGQHLTARLINDDGPVYQPLRLDGRAPC